MLLFAASIFLSALLLFQVQPMIGKVILPWFGGTPAVWSTVLVFFQVLLTGGYAYAYWLIAKAGNRMLRIHLLLLGGALILLVWQALSSDSPSTPASSWKPQDVNSPILDILRLLTVSIGLPYFLLASNGPLMQAWFSRSFPQRSYARLYALSNAGSLLGLLAYPVLIEPTLSLQGQGWLWALGFLLFVLLAGWVTLRSKNGALQAPPEAAPAAQAATPSLALRSLWILLSATASLFLLSVTNQITQEVAAIPFLWVLPLVLYLLSFILTFSGERGYHRAFYAVLFVASTALTIFVMLNATALHVYWQVLAHCLLLFAACMLCHGELYLLRPSAARLTTFYLMVSIGGALGGVFVTFIAPVIFNGYWELFVGLAMAIGILLTVLRRGRTDVRATDAAVRARFIVVTFSLVTVMLAVLSSYFPGALFAERNFYGVIRVQQLNPAGSTKSAYVMSHGITVHGLQFLAPELRSVPTTYYVPESGAGLAIVNHPDYGGGRMRVGLLGLGVGTLAAYAQAGDEYRLYEINPVVSELAKGYGNYFSFLGDSHGNVTTILGDARISLERELAAGTRQGFDVLVLDTFSSDSIPVHLVTREAFSLYVEHLAPQGIIAAHVTNLHLDLQPVFWQLARHYDMHMVRVDYPGDSDGGYASHWILLVHEPDLLAVPAIRERSDALQDYRTNIRLWTDDYSNLFQILK